VAYQIQTAARRCARSGRELRPGEKCYSVLYDRGGEWVREDVAPEAWPGPPPDAFSFWQTRVPADQGATRPAFDDELLLDCFVRAQDETDPRKVRFRYVLALLLLRRKRLRFEEVRKDGDQETLVMREVRTRHTHLVTDPHLTADQMAAVQEEIEGLLGQR
jgi:hypothetical protein